MTYGCTVIEYNGITIFDCQTLKFEQAPVNDPTGQTMLYESYTVRVSGFLLGQSNANSTTFISPQPSDNSSAGSHYSFLKDKLNARGKAFKMTLGFGGASPQIILDVKPLGNTQSGGPADVTISTDVNQGPIPKVLSFQQIASNTAIKIEWEVVVHLVPDCQGQSGTAGVQQRMGVLSNRWSCADEIDENYFSTRTWAGELKLAHPMRNPHDFRGLCVPAIQPGMRREKMSFTAAEDGLSLRYTVIDREVYMTAPAPAHTIRYAHREIVAELVMNVRTQFTVTVKGDRTADKRELLILALRIIEGKLRVSELIPPNGAQGPRQVRQLGYEVFEESGTSQENSVTASIQLLHIPNPDIPGEIIHGNAVGLLTRINEEFGKKLDDTMLASYFNTLSLGNRQDETPLPYGPIPMIGAFSVFLQSPCTIDRGINNGLQVNDREFGIVNNNRAYLDGYLPQIDGVIVPELTPDDDTEFSSAHQDAIYQTYLIDSEYQQESMISPMPLSVPSSSVSSGGLVETGSVFVRCGPSQYRRVVRIVAERHGKPPRLFEPTEVFTDSDEIKHVLIDAAVVGGEPTRAPDGEAKNYTIRAEFTYGLSGRPGSFKFGAPDYDAAESSGSQASKYNFTLAEIFSSHQKIG